MPYIEPGSYVFEVGELQRRPELLASIAAGLSSECRCMIVDSPFVATVERSGLRLYYTVGVGSIVCSPGCGYGGSIRLVEPAWGQGRVVHGNTDCIVLGELGFAGIRGESVGYHEFFDAVLKGGRRGVAILAYAGEPLEVENLGPKCGRLYSRNPLHPAGVVGKTGVHACCDEVYEIVSPSTARLLQPVLALNSTVIVSTLTGLGEGLVVGYDPFTVGSPHLRLSAILGILYTCGSDDERL